MPYNPDTYVAQCAEEVGPAPLWTMLRALLDFYAQGVGSKSKAAYAAHSLAGSARVVLNGQPMAFRGGITRDADAPIYPGSDLHDAPDVIGDLESLLTPSGKLREALQGVLRRAEDDLANYSFPACDYGGEEEAAYARDAAAWECAAVRAWLEGKPQPEKPAEPTDAESES